MARLAVDGPDVRVDAGTVDGTHFLNVVGFGFGPAVLEGMSRLRWLRGVAVYYAAALTQLFRFRATEVALAGADGTAVVPPRRELLVAVGNGRSFGGDFLIAPGALTDDGELDLVAIGDANALRRAQLFLAAPTGGHLRFPECISRRGAAFTLRFPSPPLYDADGELRRARSATVEVRAVPGAIRVVTAPPAASRRSTRESAP
jgi:diacylglycerol kinase (ATP)